MSVKFSEYRPSLPLSGYVQAYYTGDLNLYSEDNFVQSVVPNGCVELVIHLTSDHCELIKENIWGKSPDFTLIGLQTKSYEVKFPDRVQIFGLRFNPEGIFNIFGVPPSVFTSTFEDSKDVLGKEFDDYCSRLRDSKSIQHRIRLTEDFLSKKLSENAKDYDYVRIASDIIRKHYGLISLDKLIEKIPVSPRQLQRAFKKKFGITAKEYMRLSRLNAVQKYMQVSTDLNLTALSYESGFTDQSHFIKEYKAMTGINPSGFLKRKESFITLPAHLD
ncbi:MAG TPA: helix-turn-helix domain-containing protein [Flavobacteriaceae bacterium]|nr:helix-turn-helix domain-containing protein [Flavobacteriaceae bacterium]